MTPKNMNLIAGLVFAASATVAGATLADDVTSDRAPKTIVLVVPPMSMIPDSDNAATAEYFNGWSSGLTSSNECFNTGITLPEGAEVQSLRIIYESTSGGIFAVLKQQDPNLTETKTLGSLTTTDTSGAVASDLLTLSPKPIVNARKFGYGLGVCIDTGQTFLGAKITYKPAP
jgi:hypothetical protein